MYVHDNQFANRRRLDVCGHTHRTKRAVVEVALQEYVLRRQQLEITELLTPLTMTKVTTTKINDCINKDHC